ncbi:MAG: glycosyltransferase [Candidatus Aegiribacteria sp.]|nr:glycosyltransferase [Candidatus Aegiribacteria sp.]MBD3293952.1 glycosyltransferase [Candidatus Fermentibacteria bacterium]
MHRLEDYLNIVGDEEIARILRKASRLYRKHFVHMNSTYHGGGVAEMLSTLVPLTNDANVDAGWRILHGDRDFFSITKQFHNALQGGELKLTDAKKRIYLDNNREFSIFTHIDHDAVVIHDPQPLPLIRTYQKTQPWIWRCHIDISSPNPELWEFLKQFIIRYDVVIISSEAYRKPDLPVEQRIIEPAINPLSSKNQVLSDEHIESILDNFGIPTDKSFITQISRFDPWKDPLGVLDVYRRVRERVDCRLVLCGSMASDDPEGYDIYEKVRQEAEDLISSGDVILITYESNIMVNAIQRAAAVIIQKSLREGFGLTVTEGLWKQRPVVASNVGGIPLQIEDGKTGYLLEPDDHRGFADKIISLLEDPEKAREMGVEGREKVRKRFLTTRLLSDYLDLVIDVLNHDLE